MLKKPITTLVSAASYLPLLALLSFTVFFYTANAQAGQATLTWDANTQSILGGYKLYYGPASRNYTTNVDVGLGNKTTADGTVCTTTSSTVTCTKSLQDGTYYFAVTAYNSARTTESGYSNEVIKTIGSSTGGGSTAPVANFSATPTSGTAPLTVTFSDASTGTVTGWSWSFGDGTTSTGKTAVKTYTNPGTYNVSLTVNGSNTATKNNYISVTAAPPVANFSATPITGPAPQTVNFTDTSTGTVTGYSWTFGDGGTSTAKSPAHTYTTAGTYTVTLTATGPAGNNTKTQTSYITIYSASSSSSPSGSSSSSGIFQQNSTASYLVVMEAEHYKSSITQGGYKWLPVTNYSGYSGTGALQAALPADNVRITTGYASTSPRLDYQVQFARAGTHYVWIRALGPSISSDSVYIGLDGSTAAPTNTTIGNLYDAGSGNWVWWNKTQAGTIATLDIPSAGLHTVSVWMRESGAVLDKLVLTPDATYVPSGLGPTETAGNTGLVAAYSFNEGTGTDVADASGKGNKGTIKEATWTISAEGRFGRALSFDGINDWVTVNDSASLDLTNGMTLEAWVYPTATMRGWRSVLAKEQSGGVVYYLDANSDSNQPATGVFVGGEQILRGGSLLTANQWVHLAATYDGTTERLYVNGSQVASRAQAGTIQVSTGALRIGGNGSWGEYFQGRIDEVRIYNRALSVDEIKTDMNAPVK